MPRPKRVTWSIYTGPVAARPQDARETIRSDRDRVTFMNSGGDYFEVYLLDGELVVRVSGASGPLISVRPESGNVVRVEMIPFLGSIGRGR